MNVITMKEKNVDLNGFHLTFDLENENMRTEREPSFWSLDWFYERSTYAACQLIGIRSFNTLFLFCVTRA